MPSPASFARAGPQLRDGHLIILGQTGLGKTALVRSLVRAGRRAWSRILIADPHREYGQVAVAVRTLEEWAAYTVAAGTSWAVAYQGDDLDLAMAVLCEAAYDIGELLLVAEEADYWCSSATILPELAHLVKYGRHRAVWLCGVARRPSEVHRLLTSQARHVVAFGSAEPLDLDYLRKAVSAEFADAVSALPPLVAAWWDRRARQLVLLRVDPAAMVLTIDRQAPAPVE